MRLYIKKLVFWLLWCHWHNKCLNAASSELPVTWLSHLAAISEDTSILSWYTFEEECTCNSRESVVVFQGIQGKTWFAKTREKYENQKAVELFVKILLDPTLWILLWVLIYLRKLGDPNKTLCVWRVSSGFASLSNGLDTKLSIGHGNIVKLLLLSIILQIEAPSELCMFFLLGTQFLFICVYFLCIFVGWRLPHEPLVCIKVLHMWDSMPSCCQRGSDRCSSPQGPCF